MSKAVITISDDGSGHVNMTVEFDPPITDLDAVPEPSHYMALQALKAMRVELGDYDDVD